MEGRAGLGGAHRGCYEEVIFRPAGKGNDGLIGKKGKAPTNTKRRMKERQERVVFYCRRGGEGRVLTTQGGGFLVAFAAEEGNAPSL